MNSATRSDEPKTDVDARRDRLARRIHIFVADHHRRWRTCREGVCRRKRGCVAPHIECSNPVPLPPKSEAESADAVQKMLVEFRADVERACRASAAREAKQGTR